MYNRKTKFCGSGNVPLQRKILVSICAHLANPALCSGYNHGLMASDALDFPPIRDAALKVAEAAVAAVLEGQNYAHARVSSVCCFAVCLGAVELRKEVLRDVLGVSCAHVLSCLLVRFGCVVVLESGAGVDGSYHVAVFARIAEPLHELKVHLQLYHHRAKVSLGCLLLY